MTPTKARARARSDELAIVDRLMRMRSALSGMAHELGVLRREHRRLVRENDDLRGQVQALRQQLQHGRQEDDGALMR